MLFVGLTGVVAETLGNELVDKLVEGEVELLGMKREGMNAKTFGDSMFDILEDGEVVLRGVKLIDVTTETLSDLVDGKLAVVGVE